MHALGAPSAPRPTTSAGFPENASTACWTASASSRRSPFIGRPTAFLPIELWPGDLSYGSFLELKRGGAKTVCEADPASGFCPNGGGCIRKDHEASPRGWCGLSHGEISSGVHQSGGAGS